MPSAAKLSANTSQLDEGRPPAARRESWVHRWRRRFLSIGGIYLAFGLALILTPILVSVGFALDVLSKPRRYGWLRFLAMLLTYLACESIALICTLLLWLLSPILGKERFIRLNYGLQERWTQTLFNAGRRIYGIHLDIQGLDQVQRGPMIVFVRHVSVADTLLPAALIANRFHIRLRYVLKRELLWDPCLDVVGQRISNAFVARDGVDTEGQVAMVRTLAEHLGPDEGVLIFPEGTRFSHERLARLQARARDRGDRSAEDFKHVLPPRLGGPLSLLDAAPNVDVVVLAHTGFDRVRRFEDLLEGALCGMRLKVQIKRIAAADIPAGDEKRAAWLYSIWRDVDAFVAESNAP